MGRRRGRNPLGGQRLVGADGDGELDVVLLGEAVQPVQELLHRVVGGVRGDDLGQAVDEHMGNIVVAGIEAADEALHKVEAGHIKVAGFHQANLIVNVIGQLGPPLDADDVAVLAVHSGVNELDHLLGLAGALDPHDHSHHSYHSLHSPPGTPPAWCIYVTIFTGGLQPLCKSSQKIPTVGVPGGGRRADGGIGPYRAAA